MAERVIREFRKKISDIGSKNFSDLGTFPIGTEGIYTNMFSGLTLEEDLRIGGDKDIIIRETDNYIETEIKYYLLSIDSNDKPFYDKTVYYKIVKRQYNISNVFFIGNEPDFLITENQLAEFIVLPFQIEDNKNKIITIELYTGKNGEEQLIREKVITYNNSDNNQTVINEQIVFPS